MIVLCRTIPAEEVGLLIVTVEKDKRARADSEFTVSSVVEIATEERTALSPAASQSKTHEVDLEVTDEAKGPFLV
jgi:hypothetical protein